MPSPYPGDTYRFLDRVSTHVWNLATQSIVSLTFEPGEIVTVVRLLHRRVYRVSDEWEVLRADGETFQVTSTFFSKQVHRGTLQLLQRDRTAQLVDVLLANRRQASPR